ncbi:MAG TPA: lipid-A-disaccharide synthase [Cyclobacteriaceae bacterium]|nr:lipid-A-disaccharide synthase [Cyclobacteriaceae bacterium]
MKYYLIAGERSGDLHGGNLIRALNRHDPEAKFRCFGGDDMQQAGADLVLHYNQLAMMGLWEVMKNIWRLSKLMKHCRQDILQYKPDVVILIDFGGFNLRIAKFLKQQGIKVFYYISPKVWAWNQGRARKIKKLVDRMFVILPFEKEFYLKYNWQVDYVGNPVLDAVKQFLPAQNFRTQVNGNSKKVIAVLPGSRAQELIRILPELKKVAQMQKRYHFVVAAVKTLPQELYAGVKSLENVQLVFEQTYDLLCTADAAIVTSGTATLETALFKVPQVVVYKTSTFNYAIGSRLVKVDYISLPNLVANKAVVKELLQDDCTATQIADEVKRLVENSSYREEMMRNYDSIYNQLDTGSASDNTAKLMLSYLKA